MANMSRGVAAIVPATRAVEGGGFVVTRPFPTPSLSMLDPFLLLDEMGPADYAPGEAKGAPDHPHRGFETVTYALAGEFAHEDSAGHHGRMGPGDVQWMTAGSGVVHSEMPSARILEEGGRVHGVQLWVNLPQADKMVPPRYQDLRAQDIPVVGTEGGGAARVIAGDVLGVQGPARTHTPIVYVHASLPGGASVTVPAPAGWTAFAYVLEGAGRFGPVRTEAGAAHLVLFDHGDRVEVAGAEGDLPLEVLVLAGRPLREPVARYGPFVMNTRDELVEAFDDYQAGRLGAIAR
jgi:redox-sensitive bicupin YhaK (pirin superfamily)